MSHKDLLKQAIAEAKTIREAAIANAKEALEESLTPHLKEMLAQKLQEMEEMEEEDAIPENPEDYTKQPGYIHEEDEEEAVEPKEEAGEEAEVEAEKEEGEEAEGEEDINIEDMTVEDLRDLIQSIVSQEMGSEEPEGEEDLAGEEIPGEEYADDMQGAGSEEEIDINELLAELDALEEAPVEEEEVMDEVIDSSKEDLEEAMATIEVLRGQLQEVNLLNAKLLYVNKVFKSSNLTESQKVNVIAAFDKAITVREVKLVFETVSKNVVAKPAATIKEHRSFASKQTGSTSKEIIPQVSEQVLRMQKLAGIIK